MKYCAKCGDQNDDSVLFCKNCGTKFEVETETEEKKETPQPQLQPILQTPQAPPPPQQPQQYQPPQPPPVQQPYYRPQPFRQQFKKKSSFWVMGLRIIAWIGFVVMLLTGLVGGIGAAVMLSDAINPAVGILAFLGCVIGGFIIAFLAVATIMIFLDLADNVLNVRRLLEEQTQQQQNQNNQFPNSY